MKKKKLVFKRVKKKYFTFIKKQEILGEPFYNKLKQLNFFYLPICDYIFKKFKNSKKTFIIGLSGGQGSGKSTIAQIIKIILKTKYNLNVVNFSIDDYYKTFEERVKLSRIYSKLFITRGVPGTHDTKLLMSHIKKLKRKNFKQFSIPKFDKSIDDRMKKKNWVKIKKKPQIIIFEGWCVGARPQSTNSINKPINRLEKYYDVDLTWRKKVNNELKKKYNNIFKLLNILIYLKVPNFKSVLKWRILQEKKLKIKSKGKKVMNDFQIKKFIMYYERITKNMMKDLGKNSNIVIRLDQKHRLYSLKFN